MVLRDRRSHLGPRGGLDVPESAANPYILGVLDLVSVCLGAAGAKDLGLRDGGWRGGLGGGRSSELSPGWWCLMGRGG